MENGKIVYYGISMKHFGNLMIKNHGYRQYDPLTDIDKPVFFEGLYFPDDYRVLIRHQGDRIIFWNGTDLRNMLNVYGWRLILEETPARHYCHCSVDRDLLLKAGIQATVRPFFFGNISKYQISYIRSDTPSVYLNAHPGRETEYNIPLALEVAADMPEIRFHFYGITGTDTDNTFYHGWIDEDTMDEQIAKFQGCLKLPNDPRASQTMIKSALMAQYPIAINFLEGVWYGPDKASIIRYLNLLKEQVEPNLRLREQYLTIFGNQGDF